MTPEVKGVCRDDRGIRRNFLTPIAEKLALNYPGFGFHSFRREAVTEIASESDPYQAMRAAGHSNMDTSLLYALTDEQRQEKTIRSIQERVLGPTGLLNDMQNRSSTEVIAPESGPEKANAGSSASEDEFATAFIFKGLTGGPVQTRTADLYRVKVAL